jgi:hypothetical protein
MIGKDELILLFWLVVMMSRVIGLVKDEQVTAGQP